MRVGRVEEDQVVRRGRAGRVSAVATGAVDHVGPGKPIAVALAVISAAVRRSCSTSVTTPAPRDQASSPTAPEPGVQVEEAQPGQRAAPGLDRGEQRLAHPVGGRPGVAAAGGGEPAPPR